MNKELFNTIQKEAKVLHEEILEVCKLDAHINEWYKGCQIYFSPIVEYPDVMFLGINPGQGFSKNDSEHKRVEKFEPLEMNEYLQHSYTLADSWKRIFRDDLNKDAALINSFKTNMFFWATKGETELNKFLGALNRYNDKLGDRCVFQARKWIKTMITELSPGVLIVEGKSALDNLIKCFTNNELEMFDYDVKHRGYLKINEGEGCYIYCVERIYSNLKNEDGVVEFLQEMIEEGAIK